MVARLQQIKSDQLIKALERLGFIRRRQTGSHVILRHPITRCMTVVPIHAQELKRGLLFGILKQANITQDELLGAL